MIRGYALAVFAVTGPALAFIAAVALWLNGIGPSPTDLIVFGVGTVATTAGVELGFHRYFAHRAFSAAAGADLGARCAGLERVPRPGDVVGCHPSPPSRIHRPRG